MRLIKYGVPLALVAAGSIWFCAAIMLNSPGVAICAMGINGLAGIMVGTNHE